MTRTVLFCSLSLVAPFVWAAPIGPCPVVLNPNKLNVPMLTSNGCASIITINSNGSIVVVSTGQPPFDNDNDGPRPGGQGTLGDFLIGVVNNSSSPVSMLSLTGANGFFTDLDENIGVVGGVLKQLEYKDIATTPGAFDINRRPGQTVFVTDAKPPSKSGTVAFSPSIASGKSTYFAVEGLPDPTPVPEPSFLPSLGIAFGILFAWHRRAAKSV